MKNHTVPEKNRSLKQYLSAPFFILIVILGWFYPVLGYFIPLCMIAGITISVFRGRAWCDWYCPRGSFYDVFTGPISKNKEIPLLLRSVPFRLFILSILMMIMAINLVLRWPNLNAIAMFFIILLTFTTTLGIILAIFIHPRSWCMICPIGTIANLIGRNKYLLTIDSELCVECKLCAKVCPVKIKPYIFKSSSLQIVKDADCLKCGLCVNICPTKALKLGGK